MYGKEESSCTGENSFVGLLSHHICNRKPSDKAGTFLMAQKTTHTNQEKSALPCFNFDVKS